jgi:hypothetical protein
MTTKSKSKSKNKPVAKKSTDASFDAVLASLRASTPSTADRRKELLAKVAGAVAAGLVTSPSPSIASPSGMATAAVDIAEEILKKAGILVVDSSAESSLPSASVGAAS